MSNVKKPGPVAMPQFPDIAPTDDWDSVIECVNSYAEEYAAERVREALEQAAKAVEQHDKKGREFVKGSLWDQLSKEASDRIRALIPKQ